jgi:hypothetical protein
MVACTATLNTLAADYAAAGTWIGLTTGNPGTGTTPQHEATGGSYARVQTTWSAYGVGTQNGTTVTIQAPAGIYTNAFIASASTGNNMTDNIAFSTPITLLVAGQITFTLSYTQT